MNIPLVTSGLFAGLRRNLPDRNWGFFINSYVLSSSRGRAGARANAQGDEFMKKPPLTSVEVSSQRDVFTRSNFAVEVRIVEQEQTVTGDEIRATCQDVATQVEGLILRYLERHGPSTLLKLTDISETSGSRRDLMEALAHLVDDGRVVGTRKVGAAAGQIAGATFRLADGA